RRHLPVSVVGRGIGHAADGSDGVRRRARDVRQRRLSRLRAGRRDGTGGEATRRGGSGGEARADGPGRRAPSRARGGGSETGDDRPRPGPPGWTGGEELYG